jgi:hypothetical protein
MKRSLDKLGMTDRTVLSQQPLPGRFFQKIIVDISSKIQPAQYQTYNPYLLSHHLSSRNNIYHKPDRLL